MAFLYKWMDWTKCFCLLHIKFQFKRLKAMSLSTYLVTLSVKARFSEARIIGIVCFHIQSISDRNIIQYSESLVMLNNLIHIILHLRLSFGARVCVCFWVVFVYVHASVHAWVGLLFCLFLEEERGHLCVYRQGFARASLTAKKQAVLSPATASTEIHRNLCVLFLWVPFLPG